MKLTINQFKDLCEEHWGYKEIKDEPLAVTSGENIILTIEHISNNEELENKQIARLQLLASSPELAKAIANILDTATTIILESKNEEAYNALHEAFHVLKKVLDQ